MTGSLLKKKDYLGPLSFYRVALSLALPVMAQNLIQSMVSLIDNFMVAGLGDIKMSGVNIAGQINFVFYVLLTTLCASGGIFMSQYNGAKDAAGMRQAFRFKIIITLAASIAYTIFCLANPKPVLALMVRGNRQSAEIVEQACIYMKTAAFTWIPIAIAVSIGSSMREIGRVRQPLVVSAIATFINTFFNWVFIYGNLGAPRLEVKGAAIATIIARASEALIFLIYIRKTKPPFFSYLRELFRVRFGFFVNVLSKSGMILVSEMSWVLTESVVTALYNSRGGAEIVSGMSAGFTVANLFFICFYGINASIGVIMGGTLGSNQLEKAKVQKTWLLNGAFEHGHFGMFYNLFNSLCVFAFERSRPACYAEYGFFECVLYADLGLFERAVYRIAYGRRRPYGRRYGRLCQFCFGAAGNIFAHVFYFARAGRPVRNYKTDRLC